MAVRRLALAVVLAVGLAGCSHRDKTPTTDPVVTASASASVDAGVAAATGEILAAYNAYFEADVKARASADYNSTELVANLGEPLRGIAVNSVYRLAQRGLVYRGRPGWVAKVTRVSLGDNPPGADVEVCLETKDWQPVAKATGQPVAASDAPAPPRYKLFAKAKRVDGRWYIYEQNADRGATC